MKKKIFCCRYFFIILIFSSALYILALFKYLGLSITYHDKGSGSEELSHKIEGNVDISTATVVQCRSTQGNVTMYIQSSWSEHGSKRFLELVDDNAFDAMPVYRVHPGCAMQFGIRSNYNHQKWTAIPDDSPTSQHKRDIQYGYMFLATSGPNTRRNEVVIALCNSAACTRSGLGTAAWEEVPFGRVAEESFPVLDSISSSGVPYPRLETPGQHPDARGPEVGKLVFDETYLLREYPFMEYWLGCNVMVGRSTVLSESAAAVINKRNSRSNHSFVRMGIRHADDPLVHDVILEILPEWAPIGAARFLTLVEDRYFEGSRFFRVIKGFMAQFGMHNSSSETLKWNKRKMPDDPALASNRRGTLSFASAGPNTRANQIFINFVDNAYLDNEGFAPFARVLSGMNIVDKIYSGYGEGGRGDGRDGKGPSQWRISQQGNQYLNEFFPRLSYIDYAALV